MKSVKNSVAVIIKNDVGDFLVVKRPENEDGPLAGVWGFPAITLKDDETEEDAVRRIGPAKLGLSLKVISKIGEKSAERNQYILHLSDYTAEIIDNKQPSVPQSDKNITQYVDLKYTNDPKTLFLAARKGSLCSQVYLESKKIEWN